MRFWLSRLRFQPPAQPAARALAVATLIDWAGTGVWITASTLFFARVVGLRPGEIGLGLALAGAVGMIAVMPAAALTRRWRPGPVAVALQVCRGLSFLSYLLVHSATDFFLASALVAVFDRPAVTVNQIVVGRFVPAGERNATMAAMHVATNIGIAAGALLGTLALLREDRASFGAVVCVDAASFFLAAGLVARAVRGAAEIAPPPEPAPAEPHRPLRGPARDWRFCLLTVGNGLLALHVPLLNVMTPLWLARRTAAPAAMMGGLYLLNTGMVVLLQVPIARRVRGVRDGVRASALAAGCLVAACAALGLASLPALAIQVGCLVLAVVGQTLGEIHQGAAGWALSFGLSPADERQPSYLGFFGTAQAGTIVLGPALLTALTSRLGAAGFIPIAAILVFGALCVRAGAARGIAREVART